MPRKKKAIEPVAEVTSEIVMIDNKVVINTTESYLFQIKTLTDNIKLYKVPIQKNPQGKLKKGQICNVICEINYTPIKMYKLDTGYYIIADQNIQKI